MKLNQTYPLMDLLDALTAASDNTRELAKQLKAEGRHMTAFTVYEAENMLSVSPHARVTLTRKESDDAGPATWKRRHTETVSAFPWLSTVKSTC